MVETAIIGIPRVCEKFALYGGNWDPRFPITNVQNDEYAYAAISMTALPADTWFEGDSGYLIPLRMGGIAAHNFTLDAFYQLIIFNDTNSPTEILYDSGLKYIWPAAYTYEGRQWDTYNFWTGQYTEEEIEGQIPFCPILIPETLLGSKFRLYFYDENNPAGKVRIGLFDLNGGWPLSVNPEFGSQYGYKQYTVTTALPGGLKRHDVYAPSYVFQGSIPYMDRQEVQNLGMELQRQYGVHRAFMWMPDPEKPEEWLRNSKMVNLVDPGLFSYAIEDYDSMPLNLEEYKG